MPQTLSKSKLLSSYQCPRRVYLEFNPPELTEQADIPGLSALHGKMVGDIARRLYPEGALVPLAKGLEDATRQTQELLLHRKTIYEATFVHQGIQVKTDILLPGVGGHSLIEVKASTGIKDYHLIDTAIQAWVLEQAGHRLQHIALAHVNKAFTYTQQDNYQGLLTEVDIRNEVRELYPAVGQLVEQTWQLLAGAEPVIAVGEQCYTPFTCPFIDYCASPQAQTDYPVTTLPGAGKLVRALQEEGIVDIRDIPSGRLTKAKQLRVWKAVRDNGPVFEPELKPLLAVDD